MSSQAERLLKFIEESPSCFHVVENVKKQLTAAGFEELKEKEASFVISTGI